MEIGMVTYLTLQIELITDAEEDEKFQDYPCCEGFLTTISFSLFRLWYVKAFNKCIWNK